MVTTVINKARGAAADIASVQRNAAIASLVGTAIEFYDFVIYAAAAALVFNKMFFPQLSGTAGTVAAFGAFAVGFLARPLGSLVAGHLGDRPWPQKNAGFIDLADGQCDVPRWLPSNLRSGRLGSAHSARDIASVARVCRRRRMGRGCSHSSGVRARWKARVLWELAPGWRGVWHHHCQPNVPRLRQSVWHGAVHRVGLACSIFVECHSRWRRPRTFGCRSRKVPSSRK